MMLGEIEIGSEFEQLFCQLKQGRRQLRAALRSVQAVKPVKLLLFDILARGLGLGFWCCLGNMFELPPLLPNRLFRGCCVERERSEGKKAQPKPSISLERLLARATSPSCPPKQRPTICSAFKIYHSLCLAARLFVKGLVCEFSHRCKPSRRRKYRIPFAADDTVRSRPCHIW